MLANTLFLATFASTLFSSSLALTSKRDEKPLLPYDPNTTEYCTWWFENDGSVACTDMPATWAITLADLRRWNPSITAECGNFETGKSYCVEAFNEPEPVPTSSSVVSSSSTPTPTSSGGAPGPTQPGTVENCNRWDFVNEGEDCNTFINKYPGLKLSDLTKWNTGIGDQCQTLWGGVYVCTSVPGWTPTIPSSSTKPSSTVPTPTNGIQTPTPIQPGMVNNCDAFYFVKDGDYCSAIAQKNSISLSQFYAWNPNVGTDCGGLWLDVYVCVSIVGHNPTTTTAPPSTTVKPTPTNGIATPTPVQTGMVSNCDAFHFVKSGDLCANIVQRYGISLSQFYKWNPAVGSSCSALWLDTYVCVSIVGVNPVTSTTMKTSVVPTTTKAGNGVATPTPIQAGMTSSCKSFRYVRDGDNCASIAQAAGISLANFYRWNTGVGSSCQSLWLNTYVCIAVL
ncbi:hypothetical protein OPT61_g989 [Boeremia exigua]|uniref:Uncharacterized protein n=1 Tax=Boeremia exigua TaxID=749465 RepID=A0ACC2IS03_9PLEO|nr:hypothetical protein OPT61_g989 [Boeremia exigua]